MFDALNLIDSVTLDKRFNIPIMIYCYYISANYMPDRLDGTNTLFVLL